jgi:signal transduction histidine kinase
MDEQAFQAQIFKLQAALARAERNLAASEEALEHRQRQIDAMRRTTEALFALPSADDMLRQTITLAIEVLCADEGSVLLHNPETDTLRFHYVFGPSSEKLTGYELPVSQGVAGKVFRTGVPDRVDNVHERAEHHSVDERTGKRVDSMLCAPLKRAGHASFGVVTVINAQQSFDDRDLEVLEVLASVAAAAIENARLSQEARKAAIVNLIGDISHDVKNMLTPIQTGVLTLQPMLEDMLCDLDHLRAECPDTEWSNRLEQSLLTIRDDYGWILEGALDASEKVQARVREIADAVKGEISQPQFELRQINETALAVAQALRSVAGKAQVQLLLQLDENVPLSEFDEKQMYNALYNLVNNAIPETPPGGSITVRTVASSEQLHIQVSDTGRGIPERVRKLLFTDATPTTKPGGTGLGTKIVGDVVARHHGTIEVQSVEGHGSTFSISLPLQQPKKESEA